MNKNKMDQFIQNPRPAVRIRIDTDRWIVKTADNFDELIEALQLRHDVFFKEQLGVNKPFGIDTDCYDQDSDHLIVIDKESNRVVGNYRIRCSQFVDRFYSEEEFTLRSFVSHLDENQMEVGRACVSPFARNGAIIQLLWKGLMEYAQLAEARYLFGCSSWKCLDPARIEAALDGLRLTGKFIENAGVKPKLSYRDVPVEQQQTDENSDLPTLLKMYLRSGAVILGEPAYDPEFQCVDFLTLLDLKKLMEKFARRYEPVSSSATA